MASNGTWGDCTLLTGFDAGSRDIHWRTVNDNVMGGRSSGAHKIAGGSLVFEGITNTNGGGFSSIRSVRTQLDMAGAGLVLKLRGDGRTYSFRLASRVQRATWWADFPTSGEWETVFVPFASFTPRWRGMRLRGPELRPEMADGLGLMIYDKRDGRFALEVDSISHCGDQAGSTVTAQSPAQWAAPEGQPSATVLRAHEARLLPAGQNQADSAQHATG